MALLIASLVIDLQPSERRMAVQEALSTNLDNLSAGDHWGLHPAAALLGSAFVTDGDTAGWVTLGVLGLATIMWRLGPTRTAILVITGHVFGTLFSQALLAVRIDRGDVDAAARSMLDIGPSYIVVTALIAGIAFGPIPGRLACAAAFIVIAPSIFDGITELDVAAVGHSCSVLIGVLLGWLLTRVSNRGGARLPPGRTSIQKG